MSDYRQTCVLSTGLLLRALPGRNLGNQLEEVCQSIHYFAVQEGSVLALVSQLPTDILSELFELGIWGWHIDDRQGSGDSI